jgi:hypothetical protein
MGWVAMHILNDSDGRPRTLWRPPHVAALATTNAQIRQGS